MKFKMTMIVALICMGQTTFAQVNKTKETSEENKDAINQIIEYQKENVDNTTTKQEVLRIKDHIYYSDKEWKKIKRQIRRNRKRITNSNDGIHSSKVLDTIYLEIKISKTNSQITDW